MKRLSPLFLLLLSSLAVSAQDDGNIYVMKDGCVTNQFAVESVDSVAVTPSHRIYIYDKTGKRIYINSVAFVDSLVFSYPRPKADLMDIVFHQDGTAEDLSPLKHEVKIGHSEGFYNYYNSTYKRYVARFNNTWGSAPTGNYRIDYAGNTAFENALADGHSIETLIMPRYDGDTPPNSEAKPFTSHQAGGTGFLMCTQSGDRFQQIEFLPNVSSDGNTSKWIDTRSGVFPEAGKFYHVVGVWNKEEGKSYVYVNGELKATVDAVGSMHFPNTGAHWFGIGCDANTSSGELAWSGDVALARIYDKPLAQTDVTALWNAVKVLQSSAEPDLAANVTFMSGLPVVLGHSFELGGEGYEKGDSLLLSTTDANGDTLAFRSPVTPFAASDSMSFVIPQGFVSSNYRMVLFRGDRMQDLGLCAFTVTDKMPKVPEINAHRGFWNTSGSCQNSRTSLSKAIGINAFSSEIDIWLTTDNHMMVNHDGKLNGVTIQTSTYDQVKNLTLSNGELLPQLSDMLDTIATSRHTVLCIEIKTHSTAARTVEAAEMAIDSVEARGLSGMVQYCSFSLDACKALVAHDPTATVFYINGDKTPAELKTLGMAMDYSYSVYRKHPEWIAQAHELGIPVVAWTMNTQPLLIEMANAEADILATDWPLLGFQIRNYYLRHQSE